MTLARLNLLVLRCTDIRATAAFYEQLKFDFALHQHGKGPEHLASENDEFVLELYPTTDGRPDTSALGIAVDELDAVRLTLAKDGRNPSEIRDEPWGRTFVVRDPDGRRVEVKQR